jgi:HEAT repeat protein
MKTQRVFLFITLITALVGVILVLSRREPSYRGRPLTSWLQQCYETQRLTEAQQAVRAMPLHKVLPRLLKMVEAKEDSISPWIMATSDEFHLSFLKWRSAEDLQQLGIAGFEALGTNATSAVGELTKLLDDKDHAFTAFRCLLPIGKSTEMSLCRALTNQNPLVRAWSISALAPVTDDAEVYVSRLTNSLNDPEGNVRAAAVDGIGAQTLLPERVIPILITELEKPDGSVSREAAESLAGFGTNALIAFPILSNVVVNDGADATAHEALRTLVAIAPEEALPIVFSSLQSSNSMLRHVSFGLLCNYPAQTADIRSAIERAATNSDPALARRAKAFITDQYRKAHPDELLFPNEPSYGGKPLGDWLKAHDNDGTFSKDAAEAIRHMGTNAIPALFNRLVYVRPPFGMRAFDINMDATRGFIILGEQAVPALPRLQTLMDSTKRDIALDAMVASCGTGSNAVPLLIKGLTNQFPDVRNEAAQYLRESPFARDQRKQVIPLLVKLLADPDGNVRRNATNELKNIDSIVAARAGIK